MKQPLAEKISLAPMVSYSNRYMRYFFNLIAPDIVLYTEMITTSALVRNKNLQQIRRFDTAPSVCQLAGNNALDMSYAIDIAETYDYKEININLGCPSKQVQKNAIGVCMMQQPEQVAELFSTIDKKTSLPISIKCRIGIDDLDSYEYFYNFIKLNYQAGCKKFIIHARKAWLNGLNPKQNRTKPPINYDFVYKIKQDFPDAIIIINGDISTTDAVAQHLKQVDGVMLGRIFIDKPMFANELQNKLLRPHPVDMLQVVRQYLLAEKVREEQDLHSQIFLLKTLFGIITGTAGAKKWRQLLTQQMQRNMQLNIELIMDNLSQIVNNQEYITKRT